MPDKLVYQKPIDVKLEMQKRVWLKNYGTYNSFPDPITELTNVDFAIIAGRETPLFIEWREIKISDSVYIPSYIYWYNHNGIIIAFFGENDVDHPVKYYLIGCDHNLKELTSDECKSLKIHHSGDGYHVMKCEKCGYIEEMYD